MERGTRLALALPVGSGRNIIYQESVLHPTTPVPSTAASPFHELRVALYASSQPDTASLVLTTEADMVFVKSSDDLRFVRFNQAGEELPGQARENLIAKNDYDFFPPDEADFFIRKDHEVLEERKLLDIPEERIETKPS